MSDDAAEGKQAFSFSINESTDRADCGIDQNIAAEPGATYTFSFAAKNAKNCPQVVGTIGEYKTSAENPAPVLIKHTNEIYDLSSEYNTFTFDYTVGEGQVISLEFRLRDPAAGSFPEVESTMLLDAVRMEKAPNP